MSGIEYKSVFLFKKSLIICLSAGIIIIMVLFALSCLQIYSSVKSISSVATQKFVSDPVEALMTLLI